MKTFDEAFDIIKDKSKTEMETLIANFDDTRVFLKNARWKKTIQIMGEDLLLTIAEQSHKHNPVNIACASLHVIFVLGMLTGIEMEKE